MGTREGQADRDYWNEKYAEPVENKYRIILGVSVGRSQAEEEYPLEGLDISDAEWDEMDERQRQAVLDDAVKDHIANNMDSWGRVETDE